MRVESSKQGALSDLRIIDMADQSGVYCTKILADLGADVIKVEPPAGDPTRSMPPFYHGDGKTSLFFLHFNTSKRGITLNIEDPDGKELFKKLVAGADVVVETFMPGHLETRGLGYDILKKINPRLIMTSITPFGQTGPYSHYQGCDLVGLAMGGLLTICGWPDRPPVRMGGSQAYHIASAQAAAGTLVAYFQREITGEGQQVDVSVQASVMATLMMTAPIYERTGVVKKRAGDDHSLPVNGLFPCKDGYVDIRLRGHRWDVFVAWLATENMAGDLKEEIWKDPWFRQEEENAQHIDEILRAFLMKHTMEEICAGAQGRRIESGGAFTAEQVANDPQLKAQEFFVDLPHPELNDVLTYIGAPFRMSETPWDISRRAPSLGEHNEEVFRGLGLTAAELATFRQQGSI